MPAPTTTAVVCTCGHDLNAPDCLTIGPGIDCEGHTAGCAVREDIALPSKFVCSECGTRTAYITIVDGARRCNRCQEAQDRKNSA